MRRNLLTVFALTLAVVLTGVNAGNAEILRCSATFTWADEPRHLDVTIVRPERQDFDKMLALVDEETGEFKELVAYKHVGVGIIELTNPFGASVDPREDTWRYKFIEFLNSPDSLIGIFFDHALLGRNPNLVVGNLWKKPKRVYLYFNVHAAPIPAMSLERQVIATCD